MSAPDKSTPDKSAPDKTKGTSIETIPADLVEIAARAGARAALAAALESHLALPLPAPGKAATAAGITAMPVRPDCWLLMAPAGIEGAFARTLKSACAAAGSIVDQSHGQACLRLSGPRAAWTLAKLCRIDLHPSGFPVGGVAVTAVSDLPCVLHRRDATSFDLIVPATYGTHFLEVLGHAAADFNG